MEHVSHLIQAHPHLAYLIIALAAIPEGPILTVFCGFLSTRAVLNPLYVCVAVVIGDMIGDSVYYLLGRSGAPVARRIMKVFGITEEKLAEMRHRVMDGQMKTIMASKLIHGPGVVGLVALGALKTPYARFVLSCLVVTLGQSLVFLMLGLFCGTAYGAINHYLNVYAGVMFVITFGVTVVLALRGLSKH